MLDVESRPSEICISRIEIHPNYQGQGIGTLLISALADEAWRKGQDLVLDVLTVNHRAQAVYQRLGMKEVARHGGTRPTSSPGTSQIRSRQQGCRTSAEASVPDQPGRSRGGCGDRIRYQVWQCPVSPRGS
jgi:N-acetylglutamate synthase-like GNAT family acetyltransferase